MRRNLLLLIFCVFLQMEVNGQTFTYTPASGAFIIPAAAGLSVKVQAWGGGGAGGGSTNAGLGLARGGAGGGGGAYAESTFTVSLGASLTITVAGSVNGSSGADGSNGFDSVVTGFSSDVKAFGGKGGKGNTAGGTPVGGAGGTYLGTTGSNGNSGSGGATGLLISSGAGGSGAGVGGGAGGGAIDSNILANSSGNDGTTFGGGGGGGVTTVLGGNHAGGAGATGKVVIGYTCPNYNSLTSPATGTSACALIGTSTITLTSSTGLPVGTYTVTYNTSLPSHTGLTATMTVSVAGTGTFTATGLTTAGNSTITVTKLESGPCFTTIDTNNVATVVVNASPAITVQPATPAATCEGADTQTISVTATGAGLTYSWRKDGVAVSNSSVIGGQGTNTLTFTNPLAANAGSYDVVIAGTCAPTVTSNAVTVAINTAPSITVQPTVPTETCSGSGTQIMSVTATGTGLTYSWRKDGVAVSNSTVVGGQGTATLTLINPIEPDGGSYDVVVSGTCTPAKISNTVAVAIITPLSDPGGISVNGAAAGTVTTYCASTSAVFSVAAVADASDYNWIVPNGWTIVSGQGTTTITATTGSSAQTGNVSVYTSNLCNTTSSSQWIALSTIPPIAPTIALVRPDCTNPTGAITVTKPVPVTGIVYIITGTNPVVAAVSNSTGVFTGLSRGDYTVTYQNGSGCVSAAQTVSIQAANANTWDGTKWSKTNDITPPTSGDVIVFNGNYDLNVDIEGCSCQVNAGYTVTIPSGKTMTITNGVSNGGTLIFEDDASLIQFNDAAVNSGSITYKRITAPMRNFDFTYWSSPVVGQKLYDLSPNTLWDKYFSYENGSWQVYPYGVGTMDAGKGYIIRVPKPNSSYLNGNDNWTGSTYAQPVDFIGVPNNGSITIATQGDGKDNLIGNPYPSAIDADLFITENASLIGGALYFWTHNTAIAQSGSFYVYSSSDYASYTLTGGTGISSGNFVDVNNNGVWDSGEVEMSSNKPSGKIAAGQSFFVMSSASGNFNFNNSMRISASGSNSQFFKLSEIKKRTGKIEKNRVWLNLSNSDGAFKQMLVGYITGATNDIDNLYDGISYDGNTYVDFYSVNKEKKLTIQGRALPFDKTDKVPLGYRSTIEGTFKISIDKADGELTNQSVFIEDNVTKTLHNLKDGAYSFSTAKGTFDNRFVLVYVDKNAVVTNTPVVVNPPIVVAPPVTVDPPVVISPPVAVNPPVVVNPPMVANPPVSIVGSTIDKPIDENKNKEIIISVKNRLVKINSFDEIIESVLIYDLRGRQLYKTHSVKSNEFAIYSLSSSEQMLAVKIQLTSGQWIAKEIFFKN